MTNYFGTYFGYKLKKSRVQIVIFAILNFIGTILVALIMKKYFADTRTTLKSANGSMIIINSFSEFMAPIILCVIASIIMIVITMARSLKFYYDQAAMDTLGCLPLSYSQRFWGDFLSGLTVNFVSYIPFMIISIFIVNSTKPDIDLMMESGFDYFSGFNKIPNLFIKIIIMFVLVYIGVYAVTMFVSSACGKLGTSIVFSAIILVVLPGIFMLYGDFFFSFVKGADWTKEIADSIGMLPPLGPIVMMCMNYNSTVGFDIKLIIDKPIFLIINIIITALFIVGAYFIGKRRKSERVGNGFVYDSVHSVLSLTLAVMLIGVFSYKYNSDNGFAGILLTALFSFLVYGALELAQKKSFKGFGKTALRYAAVFAVCFAFLTVIKSTHSFNYYKKLPKESNIKEIHISGEYFGDNFYVNEGFNYRSEKSISRVLEEHKNMLENPNIFTGNSLEITYSLNNGNKITRKYGFSKPDTLNPLKAFSDEVIKLDKFSAQNMELLESEDFSDIRIEYNAFSYDDNGNKLNLPEGFIRGDKLAEFTKLLRYDIENNFNNEKDADKTGNVSIRKVGTNKSEFYEIFVTYKQTIDFMKNPDNFGSAEDADNDEEKIFQIKLSKPYDGDGIRMNGISSKTDDEDLKKFLSYIEIMDSSDDNYSSFFNINDMKKMYISYGVKKENEDAAMEMFARYFRKHYAD